MREYANMITEPSKAYIVLPFERVGTTIGARQVLIFDEPGKAHACAEALSLRMSGVAIVERTVDVETGVEEDRLLVAGGAVPPFLQGPAHWTMRLH
ncbi:hypothetical protein MOX02_60580 [Methylobacterium oxalidis]|uniref:Uncharacterized protein n=2 Tax=Methylobacterium oxalidis TaxID=944322 RepID=A0A512JDI9_9HYPH|nr:hypothetical protein MOX02_60580 [Methylobacterium oxalidis]GJE35859.1 hypothetical protein LDDCCGHA_6080 [Methylobacterium oxalidis]